MEQFKYHTLLIILSIFFIITSCKQPNPTPELLDPIYSDLLDKADAESAKASGLQKEIDAELKEIKGGKLEAFEVKAAGKKIEMRKKKVILADQMRLYYLIKAERRKSYARKTYLDSFNRGTSWPDPSEFQTYKKREELINAPRNWEHRVPKLNARLKPPQPSVKPPAKAH